MNTVRIAVIQIRTELEQDVTLEKAGRMVHEAAENGAQIAVLPEMFNCPYSRHYFRPIVIEALVERGGRADNKELVVHRA